MAGPYRSPAAPKRKRPRIHKRREGHVQAGGTKNEINVTPLVDVVLVLLIIFMVVTPMLHRGVEIKLPETKHHEKRQDTGEQLVIGVRADGVFIEANKVPDDKLVEAVKADLKVVSRPVHVRADKTLNYGDVRKVLEKIHEAGAQNVGMATEEQK